MVVEIQVPVDIHQAHSVPGVPGSCQGPHERDATPTEHQDAIPAKDEVADRFSNAADRVVHRCASHQTGGNVSLTPDNAYIDVATVDAPDSPDDAEITQGPRAELGTEGGEVEWVGADAVDWYSDDTPVHGSSR
jgi:hypothetical protein